MSQHGPSCPFESLAITGLQVFTQHPAHFVNHNLMLQGFSKRGLL